MSKKSSWLPIIAPIIKQGGKKALKQWHNFNRQNSKLKSGQEIVTKVDIETEKFLINKISRNWPDHGFLAEESGEKKRQANFSWIIDPIDGTTNFSIHNPLWSISIGLAEKKKIIFGAIYIPVLDELFWAEKNKGAYLNNKKITLSKNLSKKKLIHTYCHGQGKKARQQAITYYSQQKKQALDCRQLGSAAIELSYVAAGRVDSLIIPGVNSWDVAAGALIAKEAGASVSNFSGKPWQLKDQSIVACHPKIRKDLLAILKKFSD